MRDEYNTTDIFYSLNTGNRRGTVQSTTNKVIPLLRTYIESGMICKFPDEKLSAQKYTPGIPEIKGIWAYICIEPEIALLAEGAEEPLFWGRARGYTSADLLSERQVSQNKIQTAADVMGCLTSVCLGMVRPARRCVRHFDINAACFTADI